MNARAKRVIEKLCAKEFVSDPEFDSLLSPEHQSVSDVHWTSVEACRMAIKLLNLGPDDHVLDVGSGVGKAALLFALYSGCRVTGIEQRAHLVRVAQDLQKHLRVDGVRFRAGDALEASWQDYTVIYLFNPYQEHLPDKGTPKLDQKLNFDEALYRAHVLKTKAQLADLAPGTRVLTYYGFGGHLPHGYERIKSRVYQSGTLTVYEKQGGVVLK